MTIIVQYARIQMGGQAVWTPPPLKNHIKIGNIGVLSNTGLDPLKNQTYQASLASLHCVLEEDTLILAHRKTHLDITEKLLTVMKDSNQTNKQSYQASIQCWAIMGMPAKCHLNGISMAG